jgi:hypoxanthine phosphoribosyltransferase
MADSAMTPAEARQVLADAELLCSADALAAAVTRLAGEIGNALGETQPLVLPVMNGAVVFAGQLLPQLRFPLEQDYLHVTRYGNATSGGHLRWLAEPDEARLNGRTVLVLDDILDEGITLAAIKTRLLAGGAAACYTAVLVDKDIGRPKPIEADFVGLRIPNRYVFGFGMDVRGCWRNLPALYILRE